MVQRKIEERDILKIQASNELPMRKKLNFYKIRQVRFVICFYI